MRGHTSNNVLRACLKSEYQSAKRRCDQETGTDCDYWEGKMDAYVEVGILLDIIKHESDLHVTPAGSPQEPAA